MKINLSMKHKLVFVQDAITRSTGDPLKGDQWDACNNLVITWLMNNVTYTIARSILFIKTVVEIWLQLEKWFVIANGSRKYHLIKETYFLKQDRQSISDYYAKMKLIWEEVEFVSELPCVTTTVEDVAQFLNVLAKQQAKQRLF